MRLLRDWLETNSTKSGSRVILAADLLGPYTERVERAAGLVKRLSGSVVAVKVNWHLLLPTGALGLKPLVEACREADLPLIADMKLNDIGSTNVEAADILFSNGFEALIANPFAGRAEAIGEVIERAHAMGKAIVLLVYMSHAGAKEGYGLRVGGKPLYMRFAKSATEWGADGVVVSAKSPAIIRQVRSALGKKTVLMCPGVGAQGGDARLAVGAGADYVIVGRSIVGAADPLKAVGELNRTLVAPR